MFFADAEAASAALDIALTKRGQHLGEDIPMCGVPVHAAEGYLLTLIRKGFRVAVCEQMEDPAEARKRGAKAVVRREVVRLVTPGTLTEDSLLEARRHNYPRRLRRGARRGRLRLGRRLDRRPGGDALPAGRAGADAGAARRRARSWSPTHWSPSCATSSPRPGRWRRRWRGRASNSTAGRGAGRGGVRGARAGRLRQLRPGRARRRSGRSSTTWS